MLKRVVIACLAMGFVACNVGRPIELVVPNEFSGEARIVFDPNRGEDLRPQGWPWRIVLPKDGELHIRDDSYLRKWRSYTIRHEDGTAAKVVNKFTRSGPPKTLPDGRIVSDTRFPGAVHVWVIESDRPANLPPQPTGFAGG